jgi:hypothetical protein
VKLRRAQSHCTGVKTGITKSKAKTDQNHKQNKI